MSQIPAMKEFLPGMYMHHEMVNGMGYPQGLKGDEIPLMGKIVAVADTFDAMTTDRPYQKAMKFEDAVARIESFVGTRYDPGVVAAFSEACKEGQIKPGQVKLRKPAKPATPQIPVNDYVIAGVTCRCNARILGGSRANPWPLFIIAAHMGLFWRRKKDEFVSLRLNEPAEADRKRRLHPLRPPPVEPVKPEPPRKDSKRRTSSVEISVYDFGSRARSFDGRAAGAGSRARTGVLGAFSSRGRSDARYVL